MKEAPAPEFKPLAQWNFSGVADLLMGRHAEEPDAGQMVQVGWMVQVS
jgi:hypothetical protein